MSPSRSVVAARGSALASWCGALLSLALVLGASPDARADDAAWRVRVDREVLRLEVSVATLDKQKPSVGALEDRVAALHARVLALEKELEIAEGTLNGAKDLASLTKDVAMIGTRYEAVVKAKKKKAAPPVEKPAGPPEPGAGEKPGDKPGDESGAKPGDDPKEKAPGKKPGARDWPTKVEFKATARIAYRETGQWYRVRAAGVEATGNEFLMDGYAGRLSFTLRAANLKTDVKSAVVRVAVRMKAPFTEDADVYRVYDVTWTAGKDAFGNDSYKGWPNHDDVSISGPIRWIANPKEQTATLDALAFVVSAVLPNGTELTFETPKFPTK